MALMNRQRDSVMNCVRPLRSISLIALLSPLAAAATGVSPLEAGSPPSRLNALEFGVKPGDGRDDSAALQRAMNAAAASGRVLFLPSGNYTVGGEIRVPSNLSLAGQGCSNTVLQRAQSDRGQIMLRLDGVRNIAIRGIQFEHDGAPQFYRSIGFRGTGSENVAVVDNCFGDRRSPVAGGDRWAVELSAEHSPSARVVVQGNRVSGKLQLTAGGGAGVRDLRIVENFVRGAKANGIAVSHLAQGAIFENVVIARNTIEQPDAIGVFIGPDQAYAGGGTFRNVTIADNVLKGLSSRFSYGIYIRAAGRQSNGFRVENNVLDGRGGQKSTGIRFEDAHAQGTRWFRDVQICGNEVINFERGIWLQKIDGGRVTGNRVGGARSLIVPNEANRNLSVREDNSLNCN